MTDIAVIESLEDRRWAAQIGEDTAALEALIADEMVYTHSNGIVDTKTSYIQAIANKRFDYRAENRSDTSIEIIGDTAMATGRIEIEVVAGDRQVNLDSRYSAIWVKRAAEGQEPWQFLCWQSTPIA